MSKRKKMSESDLESAVGALITDAINYVVDDLGPDRTKATEYYQAKLFGDEEEGRSQYVASEVRDTVLGIIPDLLEVIHGPEHVVEYAPKNAMQVQSAEETTDYARWVYEEDNAGLMTTYSVLVDGLVRRIGIYKWGVDDTSSTKAARGHATESQIQHLLENAPGFKLLRVTQTKEAVAAPPTLMGADGQPMLSTQQASEAEYDIEFTVDEQSKRIWIKSVPVNEFIYSREARTLDDALLVGHKMRLTNSELIALNISQDDIDEHGGDQTDDLDGEEAASREISEVGKDQDPEAGEANEKHLYIENFVKIDFDGDKIAELRRVCTLGPQYHIVANEPVERRPFSIFTPIPEPHTMIGQSYADLTMDLQLLKSSMLRAIQDSAAGSIFPRIGYVEGSVSVADVMNTAMGGPIRMKAQGDLQALTTPFLGEQMMGLLAYVDDTKENRTGNSKGAIGLDADALQSTEKAAAGAVVSATQRRNATLVRIFAEQALKPMFRGVLELIREIKPPQQMLKIGGQWKQINPETWDLNLDVSVRVALGSAMKEQKIAALQAFVAEQKEFLALIGPSPLVDFNKLSNTLRKATKLIGFPDVDSFFGEVPPGWSPEPKPEQPDPAVIRAQTDLKVAEMSNQMAMEKLKAESQFKQAELQLQAAKLELEIEKLKQQGILKQADFSTRRYEADVTTAQAEEQFAATHALNITKMELEHDTKLSETSFKANVDIINQKARIESEQLRDAANIAHEQRIKEIEAQLQTARDQLEMRKLDQADKAAAAEKAKPAEPKEQQKIEINNILPAQSMKVVRGKDGKIAGLSTGDDNGSSKE